jgi:hypothetical protein
MSTKNCVTCGKPLTDLPRQATTHTGECRRLQRLAYHKRYRDEHPEFRKWTYARQLQYWHTNPKYRARLTAYMRDYMRRRRAAERARERSGE